MYRQLVLCRKYSYYSETDSVNPEFWKSETYSYSSCCEYVVIYEDSDGYRSEDSGAEHSTHTEYRLSADSLTCEDGLDYYQVCSFCDYENLIREDEYYYHHVNRCDCLATKVDASEYGSECGGYIYIYSCPCGYRNEIENYDLECTLDEDSWHSYDDVDGKRDYYVYHYGCAVTDTYEGRNPCGFAYTIESWTEPNENCMGIRYVRYTFGIYSENPLVIEKSVETGSYYHVTESVSHDGEYYTEDGYDVYVRGHDLICVNCQKKTEEYECIEYVNSEGIVEKYEDNYIYYYADEIRYVTYRYERFEEEVLGRAFGNYQTYYGSVYYGLDGSFQSANDAYWTRDFVYSTEGTDARVVIVEQKNCEYYSLESYESKTPDWWNKYEYDYSGCVCDPVRICTTSDGYYEEDEDYNEYHYSYRYYYVTEPTCTQEGVRAEACNWCDYVNTWTVSPKGHSYDYSSDTQSYHCSRCELENFTGYDGPIVLEDLTWKLGNGEDYVIGYYVTGDYSYSIAVWLMTGDLDEDGFEIYLDITNFVEITDDGSMAYINIESIKAAIETMASSWDADYSICSDMVRISFVPDYSDVDVDCAITLDPHVLSYATDAAAEEGARPTTHSASCVFCNTVVKENETCNYYRSYYDSYTEDDVTYNVVSYTCRHCGNWYTETSWNALTDADTCEYTSYTKIEWADGSDTSSYSYTSHNWQNTFTGTVSSDEFTTTHNHGICADCGYAEEGETSCYFYTREAYDYIENGIEKHVEYKYCGYCGFTYKYVSYAILTDSSSCLYTEYITIYWDADGDGAYDAVTFTDQCPWYMHDCTSFSYISSDSDYFSAQHTAYCDCGYSSTEWCDFENTKKMLIVDGVMHTYNNYVCTDCGFEYTEDVYTEYSDDCTYTTYYVYSWTENGENKTYTEIGEGSHKSVYTFTEEEDGSVVRYNTCPCGEYCYSENTTTVTMNSAFDVELVTANTSRYFVYEVTVDVSGFYTFYSLSDGWDYETIGYIYDADGNLLYAQQNVFNENFRIRLSLEAGETYYLVTDFRQGYTGYWNGGSYTVYFTDKVR